LVIPIEIKVRELHARLLLACHAVEAGFTVVIGEQNSLLEQMERLPRGVYLDKTIDAKKVATFARTKELGYDLVAWDEESIAWRPALGWRVSNDAYGLLDRYFSWGPALSAPIRAGFADQSNKVCDIGNPRLDLLRPGFRAVYQEESDAIRSRYGRYVLLNTNFAFWNHFGGREYLERALIKDGKITTESGLSTFRSVSEYVGTIFESFKELVGRLSDALPESSVIVRPHPSENHDTWRAATCNLGNVQVAHEGNVIPWLLGASAVIHNSCTTGLEAFLLDRTVFSFRPVLRDGYDAYLPNAVSIEREDQNALIDEVVDAVRGDRSHRRWKEAVEQARVARASLTGLDDESACGNAVAEMRLMSAQRDLDTSGGKKVEIMPVLKQYLREGRKRISEMRGEASEAERYSKQKFSGLTRAELVEVITKFHSATGRFGGVRVKRLPGFSRCYTLTHS